MVVIIQDKNNYLEKLELDFKSLEFNLQKAHLQVSKLTDKVEEKNKKIGNLERLAKDLRYQKEQLILKVDNQPNLYTYAIILFILLQLFIYLGSSIIN